MSVRQVWHPVLRFLKIKFVPTVIYFILAALTTNSVYLIIQNLGVLYLRLLHAPPDSLWLPGSCIDVLDQEESGITLIHFHSGLLQTGQETEGRFL